MSYCGNQIPHEFISVGNVVKITFTSDAMVSARGFRLEYKLAGYAFYFKHEKLMPLQKTYENHKICIGIDNQRV